MTTVIDQVLLTDEELVTRAIRALLLELGPVEATRYLALVRREHGMDIGSDSVQRHHDFADACENDPAFLEKVIEAFRRESEGKGAG